MRIKQLALALAASLALGSAAAHEGHDDAPPSGVAANSAPRINAQSDLFELVGIVEHGAMTLYLDRYADNTPVKNAGIEVDSGKEKGMATANADGTYTFKSALFNKPVASSFTFTVTAGADSDLLAGDLVVPHAAVPKREATFALAPVAWIAAALAVFVLALSALVVLRRRSRRKGS